MNGFAKRPSAPHLSREEMIRQGRIVNVAQAALADFASVRTFLNSHNEQLGARPIDLAIASVEGLDAAEAAVKRHATDAGGEMS
jgi:hypothetical protein